MIYCFDTSAFIGGWHRLYPPEHFPSLWDRLADLIGDGRILAPKEVLFEAERKEDALHAWLRQRKNLFVEATEELQVEVAEVQRRFPGLTDPERRRGQADPYVIALARIKGAVVVTDEKRERKRKPITIPKACEALGIDWCDLLGMIRRESLRF